MGQGSLPGGGRCNIEAGSEGCIGLLQKEGRKGHSRQKGEERQRHRYRFMSKHGVVKEQAKKQGAEARTER